MVVEFPNKFCKGNIQNQGHYPLSRHFYKWADEHGYLIIAEVTNWQMSAVLMTSQRIKDAFEAQMKEMVENFWNSPSIVAYSTGNEYPSWTPEGDEWTRYQMEKFREIENKLPEFHITAEFGNRKL